MTKTLIFLIDGTANDATTDTFSNVYRTNQLIAPLKRYRRGSVVKQKSQVTFYLPGIGTKFTVRRPEKKGFWFFGKGNIAKQMIFGDNFEQIILRAYINLSANFRSGDGIVLLGFSRGAAAARILSRLISDFGILKSENLSLLDRMWNEFVRISELEADNDYYRAIDLLKQQLSPNTSDESVFHPDNDVSISFMGLFDTVTGPLDTKIPKSLEFRDEYPARKVEKIVHLLSMHDIRGEYGFKRFRPRDAGDRVVREIWMPGVHADVGGGYLDDLISSISLMTMCEFLRSDGGVAIDEKARQKLLERIKFKHQEGKIVINPEPFVFLRQSRYSGILKNDELHPLHYHIIEKNVFWKSNTERTVYEDRLNYIDNKVDYWLNEKFMQWIS